MKTHSFDLLIISNAVKLDFIRMFFCKNAEIKRLHLSQMASLVFYFSWSFSHLGLFFLQTLFFRSFVFCMIFTCVGQKLTAFFFFFFFSLIKLLCVKAQIKANRDRAVKKTAFINTSSSYCLFRDSDDSFKLEC